MKILIFIAIIVLLYYLISRNAQTGLHTCKRCEGKGFWKSLRGERNHCKACNGMGQVYPEK